ncbi:hypothetical protein [Deinococcus misasensis]|uniref:hypothetical protein n=1 Tax=Deinococcus misasensis TaxID=392413 RepID=UPI0012F82428|nr:hypothetical protein [Deinococcus misasensis]
MLPTALGARLQALLDRTPDLKGGSIPVVTGGDATSPAVLNILDDEELTVAGVAVPLASIPAGATRAEIQVQGIDVRFKLLGAAKLPTATSGYIQYDGGSIVLLKAQIAAARFIAASNSGKLYVTYYGGN